MCDFRRCKLQQFIAHFNVILVVDCGPQIKEPTQVISELSGILLRNKIQQHFLGHRYVVDEIRTLGHFEEDVLDELILTIDFGTPANCKVQ